MAVVTRDTGLKRTIKRLTTATGATADFALEPSALDLENQLDLLLIDARSDTPTRAFLAKLPKTTRILYIVSGPDLVRHASLFDDARVTSLFSHDDRFDEDEFIASATKALRGEVFGLQKYFPWGVTTFTMAVKNYEEKGRAIEIMQQYANIAGVRGPVRDRIQLVSDELMMNALYHAPTDANGNEKYAGRSLRELAQLSEVNPIQVQYGCSGRYFGIAVRDGGGSLSRARALEYLSRAKGGEKMEQKESGAGLGLISVLHSASKLIFNLAPDYSTEVIALFDMELFARGALGARSLHLFTATVTDEEDDDEDVDPQLAAPLPAAQANAPWTMWLVAAVLGAVLASLATAYYFTRIRDRGEQTVSEAAQLSAAQQHRVPQTRSRW